MFDGIAPIDWIEKLKTKIENGWYPGLAPVGYLNSTNKLTGANTLIKDPERFPLVRRMWELMLTGRYTPPQIVEIANKQWGFRSRPTRKRSGRTMVRSVIYKIFSRPLYYGSFEYPAKSGRWYKGNHEPMVTEAEYDRVQLLLGRQGNPRPRAHGVFPFTGLIRCGECKGMVTAEEKHQLICGDCRFKFAYRRKDSCPRCETPIERMAKPLFLRYTYYHCAKGKDPSCTQKWLSGDELEKQIDHFLSRIRISERFKDWAIKYLHELHAKESTFRQEMIETRQKAYQECVRRIDNLVKLKTSAHNTDGSLLSEEEYGQQRMELLKEKSALEELLQDAGQGVERALERSEKTFDFACTARDRFAKGDCDTKKEILAGLGSNLILKDKILSIQALEPILLLENALNGDEHRNRPIEPEITRSPQGQKGAIDSPCPFVGGQRYDVRTYMRKAERAATLIYAHFKKEFMLPVRR